LQKIKNNLLIINKEGKFIKNNEPNNYITAVFEIKEIDKEIRLINSYEQTNREDEDLKLESNLTDLKAAIEIGNDYNTSYNLVVNNTKVYGYEINPNGISTGTTLWANKNSMPKDKLNVVVDGVDVY
jgi:hypothetical protein